MRIEYKILKEESKTNLDIIIKYLGDKYYFDNFTVCYVDLERLIALVRYDVKS